MSDAGRPRVSLCLIVRNEEARLPTCLGSAADLVDEIIVVDTGSTDRTRDIAAAFKARVFDFPWIDDFAAARNESLRHATGDWIFWLDGDDVVDEPNRQKLRQLFARLPDERAGYSMRCVPPPRPDAANAPSMGSEGTVHVRLFRHHPELRWRYRIHEQIVPGLSRLGARVYPTDVAIYHTGYLSPAAPQAKLERNLRLLHLEEQENPGDAFTQFNLGATYFGRGDPAAALPYLQRSLALTRGPCDAPPPLDELCVMLARAQAGLGKHAEALASCREGRRFSPNYRPLIFLEATMRYRQGDLAGARDLLEHLLANPDQHALTGNLPLAPFMIHHNLGAIYRALGQPAAAEKHWRAAVAQQPALGQAWIGLGELYLAQSRQAELDEVLQRLDERPETAIDAAQLRGLWHLARKEYMEARALMERTIPVQPRMVGLRLVHCRALMAEGRDWPAAEQAVRELLALEPGNREGQQHLQALRQRANPAAARPGPAQG